MLLAFSVGGADYRSVRVGAFMGRRVIQGTASEVWKGLKESGAPEEVDDSEFYVPHEDIKEKYLSNIPPNRCEKFLVSYTLLAVRWDRRLSHPVSNCQS